MSLDHTQEPQEGLGGPASSQPEPMSQVLKAEIEQIKAYKAVASADVILANFLQGNLVNAVKENPVAYGTGAVMHMEAELDVAKSELYRCARVAKRISPAMIERLRAARTPSGKSVHWNQVVAIAQAPEPNQQALIDAVILKDLTVREVQELAKAAKDKNKTVSNTKAIEMPPKPGSLAGKVAHWHGTVLSCLPTVDQAPPMVQAQLAAALRDYRQVVEVVGRAAEGLEAWFNRPRVSVPPVTQPAGSLNGSVEQLLSSLPPCQEPSEEP